MTLHPQAYALLEAFQSRNIPPIEELPVQEARASFVLMSMKLCKREDIYKVEDRKIEGYKQEIKIRIYTPSKDRPLPALIYYHGGGWVIGNLDTHDALCRSLANEAQYVIISVDYSLAPEYRFPVAVEDAFLAVKWTYEHADELGIDKEFIAVGGDSAGGNLAAVVCYLANERNLPPISYQMLFYPSTGFEYTDSYERYGEGYYLTKSTMKWFREQYLNDPLDTQNPLAAPMLISDEATRLLPPAYIMTAQYDPLCDGGEQYAKKLKKAGVETTYVCYPGMIHGFLGMTEALEDGKKAIKEAAQHLKERYKKLVKK